MYSINLKDENRKFQSRVSSVQTRCTNYRDLTSHSLNLLSLTAEGPKKKQVNGFIQNQIITLWFSKHPRSFSFSVLENQLKIFCSLGDSDSTVIFPVMQQAGDVD